jgi:hypothetical protein
VQELLFRRRQLCGSAPAPFRAQHLVRVDFSRADREDQALHVVGTMADYRRLVGAAARCIAIFNSNTCSARYDFASFGAHGTLARRLQRDASPENHSRGDNASPSDLSKLTEPEIEEITRKYS